MEELKLIVDLLRDVSHHAVLAVIFYMVLNFLKVPVIIGTIGYCLNVLIRNIKIVGKE